MKKKKNRLTAFLVVCKDVNKYGKSRWLSIDLPKVYAFKEDAQKAADRRAKDRPGASVKWVVAKFREVA
jgi:hypothetical protein